MTGSLSAGQIAIDLGEEAEEEPSAVVTLILNNMDITCTVAPAIIFYNVYECCVADAETATKDVDTSAAGANVVIADGTYNTVNGSYVARIYKSYVLSEDGTEVVDNKKLHKYDGAFYSKMSMNIDGEQEGTGVLEIIAENEGLDSELHLTINGGNIKITSENDGINTNEDYVSVTTINGGAVVIGDGTQTYAVFSFAERQSGGEDIVLKNEKNAAVGKWATVNDYSYLIVAGDFLEEGTYSIWIGDEQYAGMEGAWGTGMGFGGMMGGQGGFNFEEGEMPEMPEGFEGGLGGKGQMFRMDGELSTEFVISAGGNYFTFVSVQAEESE